MRHEQCLQSADQFLVISLILTTSHPLIPVVLRQCHVIYRAVIESRRRCSRRHGPSNAFQVKSFLNLRQFSTLTLESDTIRSSRCRSQIKENNIRTIYYRVDLISPYCPLAILSVCIESLLKSLLVHHLDTNTMETLSKNQTLTYAYAVH